MCRPRDFEREGPRIPRRRSLKIESVGLEVKKEVLAGGCGGVEDADWVSLVLMPRIDGSPLVVNGCKIAADIPTFITLDRVSNRDDVISFRSSRECVEGLYDGLRLEVRLGQHCLVRGIFRSCKTNMKANVDWKMDCNWIANHEIGCLLGIREVTLSVALDRDEYSVLRERMVVENIHRRRRCRRKRCGSFKMCLPDIPEVDEDDYDDDDEVGYHCNCGYDYEDDVKMEHDYTWAVDASFWVVCVGMGLGFMLSRTCNKTHRLSKYLPL